MEKLPILGLRPFKDRTNSREVHLCLQVVADLVLIKMVYSWGRILFRRLEL